MYFQIRQLIIWPKSQDVTPRFQSVKFELGKVNVITGESRTGKSAIIPIIDYCLGSKHCSIPIDKIRDYASWYGVELVVRNGDHILVTRKAPEGGDGSVEMSLTVLQGDYQPTDTPPPRNKSIDEVKGYFDNLFALPYLKHDDSPWGDKRLSFRDLTHLSFQSQDIVANQNVLFYKTHESQYREKLTAWFDFIIGAETQEIISKRHDFDELRREVRQTEMALKAAVSTMEQRKGQLQAQITLAKTLGIVDDPEMPIPTEYDALIALAKELIDENSDVRVDQTLDKITSADSEVAKQRKRQKEVQSEIATIRARLLDLKNLRESVDSLGNVLRKRKDRLEISKWLSMNTSADGACPICGGTKHPDADAEFKKICEALARHEAAANADPNPLAACDRVQEQQQELLKEKLHEQQVIDDYFAEIARANQKAKEYRSLLEKICALISDLRATVTLANDLDTASGLRTKLEDQKAKLTELEEWLKKHSTAGRSKAILSQIGRKTQSRLGTLDVEPGYRAAPPQFNKRFLNIEVLGQDGQYHLLGEVGSASNWVSLHIAFTAALQEYFAALPKNQPSFIPSFVIYDQPSQVYFPQMKAQDDYENVDKAAVTGMFQTLAASIKETNGAWQAIVLEHAGEDIWGGIEGVHKADEWREGRKLIPESWYASETTT